MVIYIFSLNIKRLHTYNKWEMAYCSLTMVIYTHIKVLPMSHCNTLGYIVSQMLIPEQFQYHQWNQKFPLTNPASPHPLSPAQRWFPNSQRFAQYPWHKVTHIKTQPELTQPLYSIDSYLLMSCGRTSHDQMSWDMNITWSTLQEYLQLRASSN